MAKRERIALTDEARAERRKQEQQLTERAVAQLRSSSGWQRWLTVRARAGLRRLSVRNQLLVMVQDEHATYVAGFRVCRDVDHALETACARVRPMPLVATDGRL